MKRVVLVLAAMFAPTILASGVAAAEPMKNQIEVPVSCNNGENYTLVINGMSKTGQVIGSTSNIVVKSGTVTYFDPETGKFIASDQIGNGNKKGLQGDLLTCNGRVTTELVGLGRVTAVFDFRGFVTPRGES